MINILGISGGEPFLRDDLSEIIKILYKNCSPLVVDLPTNGFYTQKIVSQVEDIAKHCKNMTVDVQLSMMVQKKYIMKYEVLKMDSAGLKRHIKNCQS